MFADDKDGITFRLAHLSLHDGTTIHSSELAVDGLTSEETWQAINGTKRFWDMSWRLSDNPWPKPEVCRALRP